MNITELAMLKKMAGGGSGGGNNGGGLSIKQVTVTDRAAAFELLSNIHTRIVKAAFSVQGVDTVFDHVVISSNGSMFQLIGIYYNFRSTDGKETYTQELKIVSIHDMEDMSYIWDGNVGEAAESTQVPDAYWAAMSASLTVYYIE